MHSQIKLPFVKKIFVLEDWVKLLKLACFALGRHVQGDRNEKEGHVRQPE